MSEDMTHYIEISVLPDAEISPWHLMSVLFGRVHLLLVESGSNSVGISFPEYDAERHSLGKIMRIHGNSEILTCLFSKKLESLSADYFHMGTVTPIPEHCESYRCFSRRQSKSSPDRIRRRMMKRHGISEDEARDKAPDDAAKLLDLPFIQVNSLSSGKRFRLFVEAGKIGKEKRTGEFTCYGLSSSATVPWF